MFQGPRGLLRAFFGRGGVFEARRTAASMRRFVSRSLN
jgi:hypothetical protein